MFAADADFEIGFDAAAALCGDAHQLAHAFAIEHLKRIVGKDFAIDISRQKAARIVAAQTKSRLRQIVSAEGKERSMLGDFVRGQSSTGQFDHRAHLVFDLHAVFASYLARDFMDHLGLLL